MSNAEKIAKLQPDIVKIRNGFIVEHDFSEKVELNSKEEIPGVIYALLKTQNVNVVDQRFDHRIYSGERADFAQQSVTVMQPDFYGSFVFYMAVEPIPPTTMRQAKALVGIKQPNFLLEVAFICGRKL